MGCHEVFRVEGTEVVKAVEQYPRVTILLTSNSKYVEQRWPHQVVNRHVEVREPKSDRVVGIGRRRGHLHLQSCEVDRYLLREGVVGCHVTGCRRSVMRHAVGEAQPHVDKPVRSLVR